MKTQLKISHLFWGVFLFLGGLFLFTQSAVPLQAATITVTTTLDESDGSCNDGNCSLRDAIATAVSGDTLVIPSGNYLLTAGELLINKNLTLLGDLPKPVLDGSASSRLLNIKGNISVTLENIVVTNGRAVDGGGMAVVERARLTLIDSEIRGNSASNNGGGVFLGDGALTLTSGTISQNVAGNSGGGLYNMDGLFVQDGGTIENNGANIGGGVYVNLVAAVYTLNDGLVQQNSATTPEVEGLLGGGGVYVAAGTVFLNGGMISQNSSIYGGGIQSANGKIFLNDGTIKENEAQYGGGVYLTSPEALLTQNGGEIVRNISNSTNFGGGGVYGFYGSMVLTGGLVSQNTAVSDGGGINIRFGDLTVTGGTVSDNEAGNWGGGIFADGGISADESATLSITNLQLGENSAVDGGGLYLTTLARLEMSHTAVYSNTASANGGGLLLLGTTVITNTTVSGNQAQTSGGGIWTQTESAALNNVTIAQNTAVTGGGLFNNSETVVLNNSLLAGNSASTGPDCGGSSITSSGYNLIQDEADCVLAGDLTGTILGQDPQLEPLTLFGGSTYIHPLSADSLAIDAGDPAACPGSDQQNRPRPLDGDMNGTAVCDIGAFEYGIPLRIGDVTITEGASSPLMAVFPVTLDFAAPVTVTVAYASSNQTAVAGLDYTAVSDLLTFSPGQTAHTIAVPILDDLLDEAGETFAVTLSNPVNAYLAKAQGIGTIEDNDPVPHLSINDVTVVEGDSGNKPANFTVTLDAPSGQTVQVDYATANGTGVAGSDYTAVSGTLTFTPGQTSQTLPVSVLGDLIDEENEIFLVSLSNPHNAALSKSQGIGTIQDNDPLPVLGINAVSITEGDDASQIVQFTVSLTAPSGKPVTVNYATANQTAVAGQDYMSRSGTLIFAPGQTSRTISIIVLSDLLPETTERFLVNLSAPTNASLGVAAGVGTILDNDAASIIYLPVVIRP